MPLDSSSMSPEQQAQAAFAQQDATRVADPTQQLEAPGLLNLILNFVTQAANDPSRNPVGAGIGQPLNIDPQQASSTIADLAPGVGDLKAAFIDAPEQFGEGQNVAGIVSILSAIPGGLGAVGGLIKSVMKNSPTGIRQLTNLELLQQADNSNRVLAQRTGSISAPPGSEIVERQAARVAARPAQPSELFRGLEGLEAQGLRVFGKPGVAEGTREIISLTPNPKVPGGWKASIFEEVQGKGHTLRNVVDFASHDEAVAALNGGRAFFKDFTEIPIGAAEAMEQFFKGLSP